MQTILLLHHQHKHILFISVSFPQMSFHSFSPSDQKFATGSDDGTVRIWDFYRCYEEKVLRGKEKDAHFLNGCAVLWILYIM